MRKFKYDIDNCEVVCTSCVEEPATEENFDFFDKHSFSVVQNHVIGPLVVADKPIYRNNPELGEYEIVFTKDVCRHLLNKMFQNPQSLKFSLDHDGKDVSDKVRLQGLFATSPALEYKNYPHGSIIGTYEVDDEALLDEIRNRSGFSIEIEYEKLIPINSPENDIQDFLSLSI